MKRVKVFISLLIISIGFSLIMCSSNSTSSSSKNLAVAPSNGFLGAGDNFSIIISDKADIVYSIGENEDGQLGTGNTKDSTSLETIEELGNILQVSSGAGHSLAINEDGSVWAWGNNSAGQIGDGTTTDRKKPVKAKGISGKAYCVSAGTMFSVAVMSDGTVYTWGNNATGQLGDGTGNDSDVPITVSTLTDVIEVSAGDNHCLALKSDGTVWAWGSNSDGQLGQGYYSEGTSDSTSSDAVRNNYSLEPIQVKGLSDVKSISAGFAHCIALKNDGTVWAWGANHRGSLGILNSDGSAYTAPNVETPQQVGGITDVYRVSAGGSASGPFTLCIKNDGQAWAWGNNFSGQLGDGTTEDKTSPVQVSGLSNIIAVAAGRNHSLFLTEKKVVYGCGDNFSGQLGPNNTNVTDNSCSVNCSNPSYNTSLIIKPIKILDM